MKPDHEGSLFDAERIHRAWLDCRRRKRGTASALRFELDLSENLARLEEELKSGAYRPSRSVCFVNERPKPREIFAASFRDRVVHHLFVREVEPHWERVFVHDSYASRRGKGTHAAVERLGRFIRSATRGGRRRAWFLQLDVANFFMSIDKRRLFELLDGGLKRQYGLPRHELPLFRSGYGRYLESRWLAKILVFHDPTDDFERRSPVSRWELVPARKSLFGCPPGRGIPIGNLTSQFFGNVYLDGLDQFVKHELKATRYLRYVDDLVLVSESRDELVEWRGRMERYLEKERDLSFNDRATRLAPVSSGVNFLGYVTKPTHRLIRRRVVGGLSRRLTELESMIVKRRPDGVVEYRFNPADLERLLATLNSYLAHAAWARACRIVSEVLAGHHWLGLFIEVDGHKANRTWRPRISNNRLAGQVSWTRSRFPGDVVLFQVGNHFEIFGEDAVWASELIGMRLIAPRFDGRERAGFPSRVGRTVVARMLALGRSVLVVRQTGRRTSSGIVVRLPAVRFAPPFR